MHIPVLLNEIIENLNLEPNDIVCDLTLGGGGHSKAILEKLKKGKLFVFDVDINSISAFQTWLIENSYKKLNENTFANKNIEVKTVLDNFENIDLYFKKLSPTKIIADLGWSSEQLESVAGLSYMIDSNELDLRLNLNLGVKGNDLLNMWDQKTLEKMFAEYADFKYFEAKKLAQAIIYNRKKQLIQNVLDYKKIIKETFGDKTANKIYSRCFQALRIAVNDEFNILKNLMKKAFEVLEKDGIFLIVSFHSGEEKIIKEFIDSQVKEGGAEIVTKRNGKNYMQPKLEEIMDNIRSRSAKLYGYAKKRKAIL